MKTFLFLFLISFALQAQSTVENIILSNAVDGSELSLYTYMGVVIIFVSNVCPYDNYYGERIKGLINSYSGRIKFLLINAYQEAEESPDKMKEAYSRWGLSIPYLSDKDQLALNMLGAKKSPEAFVIRGSSGKYAVTYNGPIDDNAQSAAAVTRSYLKEAIENQLVGKSSELSNLRTIGCTIRKK
jgi:AhpC/TSA family